MKGLLAGGNMINSVRDVSGEHVRGRGERKEARGKRKVRLTLLRSHATECGPIKTRALARNDGSRNGA
jgi:hypothetical protein